MNRRMLALALCLFAGPSVAMTAAVAPASQQPSSSAPGAGVSGGPAGDAASKAAPAAAQSGSGASSNKAAMPSAASVTKPAVVLSAPDVPMKAATASTGKGAGVRDKATILPGGAKAAAPSATNSAWEATARGGAGMRRGTLETINVSAATLQVYGQKLSFNPERVKVFDRNGRPGSIFALKSGAKVHFTIDSTDLAQRRVAVIYVD